MRLLAPTLLATALALPLAPGLSAGEAAPAPAEVAVKTVMLFSSGVGYFEHEGTVAGDAVATLRFTAPQLNDILKSLQIQDEGGTVGSVVYPSSDPLGRTLKSFQVDLTGQPTVAQLLTQLRGAAVSVSVRGEKIAGSILGVETRQVAAPEGRGVLERPVLSVVGAGGIRQLPLDEVAELTLDDAKLQGELTKALAAFAQARDQDKKPVEVRFNGQGQRRVHLGYVVEAPVWKVSYRLVLPAEAGKPGLLQAWALVENQTDSDWSGVDLHLVSGRPVSFVQNLAQPLYLPRPEVQPETFAGLMPRTFEGGREREMAKAAAAPAPAGRAMALRKAGAMPAPAMAMVAEQSNGMDAVAVGDRRMDIGASVQAAAAAVEMGEQFSYRVQGVALPRQRSAMIPIVNGPLQAERVSIYNRAQLAKHPMAGALLTNSSGNHLVAGPMTVLDGGYAGDAQIGQLSPGQKRLLGYAVDLAVKASVDDRGGRRAVAATRVAKGVIIQSFKLVETVAYRFDSSATRERVLVVEHPRRDGWELVDTPAPAETADGLLRFRLPLAAGKSAELVVSEGRTVEQRMAIGDFDLDSLAAWAGNGELPAAVRTALAEAQTRRAAMADAERAMQAAQAEVATLTQESRRMQESLRTPNLNAQLQQRYQAKLADLETRIEGAQAKAEQARALMQQKQKELADWLANLSL